MARRLFPTAERLHNTNELSHEEWLAARQNTIGGSDIGAIMGLSPYSSPAQLYVEKKGLIERKEPNYAMKRGTLMEDAVAEIFKAETGLKVERVQAILGHNENQRFTANLDRLIIHGPKPEEWEILEIKTATQYMIPKWKLGAPLYYQTQVFWYMFVTGVRKARLIVDISTEMLEFQFEWDDEIIGAMKRAAEAFLVMLDTDSMPDVSANDGVLAAQLFKLGSNPEEICDLTPLKEEIDKRAELKDQVKELEKQIDEIENKVKLAMKEAQTGIIEGAKVCTLKTQSRTSFDSKAVIPILEAQGLDVLQFQKTTSYPVLKFS